MPYIAVLQLVINRNRVYDLVHIESVLYQDVNTKISERAASPFIVIGIGKFLNFP